MKRPELEDREVRGGTRRQFLQSAAAGLLASSPSRLEACPLTRICGC